MPVEPNISLGIKTPEAMSPLSVLTGVAQLQNLQNQNTQFQQQFAARRAMGPIFQSAIGPDGKVDYNKALTSMASNPDAAYLVPETANVIAQRELTQAQQRGVDIEQAGKILGSVNGVFADALGADDPIAAINGRLKPVIKALPPEQQAKASEAAQSFIDSAPSAQPGEDPATYNNRVKAWLQPFGVAAKVTSDQIEAMRGKPQVLDTGGGLKLVQPNPVTGTVTPMAGGQTGKTLAPTLTDVLTPEGGKQKAIVGGAAGTGGGVGGAGLKSELPPAQKTYQEKSATNVADLEDNINGAVKAAIPVLKRLDAMQQAASQFDTKGLMSTRADIASVVQGLGAPKAWVDKISGGSLPAAQTFRALAGPLAIDTLKQVAQGTGRVMKSEVDTFLENNPQLSTDPDAVEKVFNFMRDVSKTYYDQQQGLKKFKQLPDVKSGKLNVSDFPAWYSEDLVKSGGMSFEPQTKVTKGATGTISGETAPKKWKVEDGKLVPQ